MITGPSPKFHGTRDILQVIAVLTCGKLGKLAS